MAHTRLIFALTILTLLKDVLSARIPQGSVPRGRRFIVEYSDEASVQSNAAALNEGLYAGLKENGVYATPQLNFTFEFFNGASFVVEEATRDGILAEARKLGLVKNIWEASYIRAPPRPDTIVSGDADLEKPWDNRIWTGIGEIHQRGILGEGITVGVLDSGIDYTHPAFGNGFGEGFKIVGGYDFVGDNWDGKGPLEPDGDPMDGYIGHGTHVSGIIAAEDPTFESVAPKVKLRMYKVFNNDVGSDDAILGGIAKALEDGCDIINMSLGADTGWTEGPISTLIDQLASRGVIVVMANGNGGKGRQGLFTPATAANMRNAISVGAMNGLGNPSLMGQLWEKTSWGPTWGANIAPFIVAPGGWIYSTIPVEEGSYAFFSGTSMASPYIAGLAALYLSSLPDRIGPRPSDFITFRQRLIASAEFLSTDSRNPLLDAPAPVPRQGAGLVSAPRLFDATTLVFPPFIEINDTRSQKPSQYIEIQNTSPRKVKYSLSHQRAVTVAWLPSEEELEGEYAIAEFSQKTITVRPGTKATVRVTIHAPVSIPQSRLAVYGGKIVIMGDNGDRLGVPYQGVHGSFYDVSPWGAPDVPYNYTFPSENRPAYELEGIPGQSLWDAPYNFSLTSFDKPATYMKFRFGTREVRWDIVTSAWTDRDPVDSGPGYVGSHPKFPIYDQDVGVSYNESWNGVFADGRKLEIGPTVYRHVWRALKIGGIRERSSDWWTVVSPQFMIVPYDPEKETPFQR